MGLAGSPAALVEQVAGEVVAELLGARQRCELVRILVAYLAPGKGPLTASGTVVRHGRTVGLAEVWVRDRDGTAVAKGLVTYRTVGQ